MTADRFTRTKLLKASNNMRGNDMVSIKDYESSYKNHWCPGCGNFGILTAMKDALVNLGIPPEQLLIISGIGQAAKTPHFLKCNMFHALHGRALPLATGAKMANHHLNIIVNSGDGDCYGEGGNHFIHGRGRYVHILKGASTDIASTNCCGDDLLFRLQQCRCSITTR